MKRMMRYYEEEQWRGRYAFIRFVRPSLAVPPFFFVCVFVYALIVFTDGSTINLGTLHLAQALRILHFLVFIDIPPGIAFSLG